MRSHLLALPLSLLALACTDDARSPSSGIATSAASAPHAPAAPSPAATPPVGPPRIHDVAGLVVDAVGTPVVGRPIVVVDARGERVELMTDEGGTFHAMEIAPPYDVAVDRAPSGAPRVPVAYLGLTREAPRIALPERPSDVAPSHTFRVVVDATCPSAPCTVAVATTSAHGAGAASRVMRVAAGSLVLPVEHAFNASFVRDTESMELDVLVSDASGASFAYARAAGIAVEPGARSDVEMVPAPVPIGGPLTIDATGQGIPPGWSRSIVAWLELPSGATLPLARALGPALVLHVPLVPGATIGASASAAGAATSVAWSGPLDLRTSFVRLEPRPGLAIERPAPSGTLSRRGTGMVWSASPWAVTLSSTEVATGQPDLLVHTSGAGLSLRRLDRLGVAPLALGAHLLDVTSYDALTVDDLAAETAVISRRSGGRAEQRVAFDVTP